MPKVYLREKDFQINAASQYIFGEMRNQSISNIEMAERLGMSRNTFASQVRNGSISLDNLITVFDALKTDDQTILRIFRGRR